MAKESITVYPGTVTGRVTIPSSKSLCHRAIICAALAEGESSLRHISWSKDIEATVFAMERMGAIIWRNGDALSIRGIGGHSLKGHVERLFCGESASTVRFLIPIAGVMGLRAVFTGLGRLPERPLDVYYDIMDAHGFEYQREGAESLPLTIAGPWSGGRYLVPGNVSSQFITGLLLALPLALEDSMIEITNRVESAPYIEMTLDIIRRFGVRIEREGERIFRIPGGQTYQGCRYYAESDYSQAAAFLAAGACAGEPEGLILDGLNPDSIQGDRAILKVLADMQAETEWLSDGGLLVKPASDLTNITWSAKDQPDLVPALCALASFGKGTMRITDAARLRLKECDRLHALAVEMRRMGVEIAETEDGLRIEGETDGLYEGGEADSWNDHRIAMALGILALRTFRGITVAGADCVQKSWPSFWKDLERIGGGVE